MSVKQRQNKSNLASCLSSLSRKSIFKAPRPASHESDQPASSSQILPKKGVEATLAKSTKKGEDTDQAGLP